MHALIFRLAPQGPDLWTLAGLHSQKAGQVGPRTRHHARHASDCFEHHGTVTIAFW